MSTILTSYKEYWTNLQRVIKKNLASIDSNGQLILIDGTNLDILPCFLLIFFGENNHETIT